MSVGIWKAYASRGLSAWGDRMWNFAVGLFMAELSPGSLQLPAIYGLTIYLCVIFLGGPVGRWVDKTPRLIAAQSSLALQNGSVLLCASCICLTLYFKSWLESTWAGWALPLACTVIIILAGIGTVASLASSLCLNKDWIVVLAGGDKGYLSKLNSHFRSIDLSTYILAPILVGQIITWTSLVIAAVVIAAWNLVSVFLEYYLLLRIYLQFPTLAVKKGIAKQKEGNPETNPETDPLSAEHVSGTNEVRTLTFKSKIHNAWSQAIMSWEIYWSQSVRNAGLALASLYMTVLGFDTITTGYAYSQHVSEWILGILTALGALVGLLGSISFPYFVKCMGLERTGLYGFSAELFCLAACVVSILLPGSPFHLYESENISDAGFDFTSSNFIGSIAFNETISFDSNHENSYAQYISIAVMLSGIVTARFGLWLADLSVTQIMQENIPEDQRGAVGGVQDALQASMNTLKFALVAALPRPDMFGYLVVASYLFIFFGWALFASYSRTVRGHLLPFHRIFYATHEKDQHRVPRDGELDKSKELQTFQEYS